MNIDIIITWPTSCDFPVWRNFLRHNRQRFNDVFVVMSNTNEGKDYSSFLEQMLAADRVKLKRAGTYMLLSDWRNSAVNAALSESTADWVWFTEQDFFIADPDSFFADIKKRMQTDVDVIHIKEDQRIHPACMFVRRSEINKTKRDFGIISGKLDHFGVFVEELTKNGAKFSEIKGKASSWFHMNGLTHNYKLIEQGNIKDVYQPGLFQLYNTYARLQGVPQHPDFINLTFKADDLLSPICKFFRGR